MDIKINEHPFYKDPRFITERQILEKLTEICGFDTSIGVIDYFPTTPTVEIGFIQERSKNEIKNQMPIFQNGSKITIMPLRGYRGGENPLIINEELTFEATRKILVPLIQNWIAIISFLVEFYESDPESDPKFVDSFKKSVEFWKKDFTSFNEEKKGLKKCDFCGIEWKDSGERCPECFPL